MDKLIEVKKQYIFTSGKCKRIGNADVKSILILKNGDIILDAYEFVNSCFSYRLPTEEEKIMIEEMI